jgi:histidine ammonia-lyase
MIPHVVAASLVSENKVLAHPAVVDSIPTSADKEDHVSMGPIAAFKARRINKNVARVLAIEVLSAAQGVDFHQPLQPSPALAAVYQWVRKKTPTMDRDQVLSDVIEEIACGISQGELRQLLQGKNVKTHEELMPC